MGQYAWVIDVTMILMILALTWVVASEGLWGSALMLINVLFGGLIAFSLYEPLARVIDINLGFMKSFSDFTSLLLIFGVAFTVLRIGSDMLGPTLVRFTGPVDQIGRFLFGGATAWYMVGMILCMVQTAPVHKKFLGYQWQNHAVFGAGIDRFWLGFVRESTSRIVEWNSPRPFDASCDFILRYHDHRQFGEADTTLPGHKPAPAPAVPGAEGQPAGGQPGGGQAGGRPPVNPGGIALP